MSENDISIGAAIAARVASIRLDKKMSQRQFAASINTHPSQYQQFEGGTRNLSEEAFSLLCTVHNANLNCIFTGQGSRYNQSGEIYEPDAVYMSDKGVFNKLKNAMYALIGRKADYELNKEEQELIEEMKERIKEIDDLISHTKK